MLDLPELRLQAGATRPRGRALVGALASLRDRTDFSTLDACIASSA